MSNLKKLTLLILLGILAACATSPTGRRQLMLVSPEAAISASKQAYFQTLKPFDDQGKINNNHADVARVNRITGRLIAQAIKEFPHTRNWEWSVKIIDDPKTVNAWCMAGGRMAIYTGLLLKIRPTDDELAQVMAHEIGHALANHTAEKMSISMASQVGVLAATAAADRDHRMAALAGASLAAALAINLPNSRVAETEADRIGIELAAKAGYDPHSAATLWEKMGKLGGSTPPQFLSTHPSPGNRQQTLAQLAGQMIKFYRPHASHPVYPLR